MPMQKSEGYIGRTVEIRVLVTPEEKRALADAAEKELMPVSSFLRAKTLLLIRGELKASRREMETA